MKEAVISAFDEFMLEYFPMVRNNVAKPWDPDSLCDEMLGKVPVDGTCLVICSANFLRKACMLKQYSEIWFVPFDGYQQEFALRLRKKYPQIKLIETSEESSWDYNNLIASTKKWLGDMKFDVIVGNPPYQAPNGISSKLWIDFVLQASSLIKHNGYVGMIVPNSWIKPLSNEPSSNSKKLNSFIFNNEIVHTNLDTREYFNVSVITSYFVICANGKKNSDTNWFSTRPKDITDKLFSKIEKRFVSADETPWKRFKAVSCMTEDFKFPIKAKKGIMYSQYDDKKLRTAPKVIITRDLGYFVLEDNAGEFGFYWQARAYICQTEFEAKSAYSFFSSEYIKTIMKRFQWTPQTDFILLSMLKLPKFDKIFSNSDIEDFYGVSFEDVLTC